jgi:hypothetical protein
MSEQLRRAEIEQARLAQAVAASATARSNRPRFLLFLAIGLLAIATAYTVSASSSLAAARSAVRSQGTQADAVAGLVARYLTLKDTRQEDVYPVSTDTAAKLEALKEELKREHRVSTFKNPDDLAARVTADLHNWLFNKYLTPILERAARGELPLAQADVLVSGVRDMRALNLPLPVELMARHQLGKELSDADAASIVTWLKALTGEIPKDYVAEYKVSNEIPPAPKPSAKPAP